MAGSRGTQIVERSYTDVKFNAHVPNGISPKTVIEILNAVGGPRAKVVAKMLEKTVTPVVTHTLLSTYKEISEEAGVSKNAVSGVIKDLQKLKLLSKQANGVYAWHLSQRVREDL